VTASSAALRSAGLADRRQGEPHRPVAPGRQDAADAESHHHGIAALGLVDRLAQ